MTQTLTRDGETYDHDRDGPRLHRQAQLVFDAIKDGRWRTLHAITERTGEPEASVSARLRDLRKPKFGGFTISRRYVAAGVWEYRMGEEE